MSYRKWVLFILLFLFVASDSAFLIRDTIPADLCIGWMSRQAIRVIEFPGIFLFEKINPTEFYLDQPRNRIAAYVFSMDFLIYLLLSVILAAVLKQLLDGHLRNILSEFQSSSQLAFAFGVQSLVLALGGLFEIGHVFGFLAAVCGEIGVLQAAETNRASYTVIAKIGRAAGVILVVAWTLGIYFASPFMSA